MKDASQLKYPPCLLLFDGSTGFYNDKNEWQCTGSRMGRSDVLPDDRELPIKLRMRKLRFVDGDYDEMGAYWGSGNPIWFAGGEDAKEQVQIFVRAETRSIAKDKIRTLLPKATFHR